MAGAWDRIRTEAAAYFRGPGAFPLRAYSEFMPPPWVALRPYAPGRLVDRATGDDGFAIGEFEGARALRPGLEQIAQHVVGELDKLRHGHAHGLSRSLLDGNDAWPDDLAAGAGRLAAETLPLLLPLALSLTQDDKGRVRWTLFGSSHTGPARAFWRSFAGGAPTPFLRLLGWLLGVPAPATIDDLGRLGVRIVPRAPDRGRPELDEGELPGWARPLLLDEGESLAAVRAVLTFEAFARLPGALRGAFLRGALRLLPWPGSLVFWEHPGYRKLVPALPWAMQVPLLHLFPRCESHYGVRIPQSGWLDEGPAPGAAHAAGHRVVHHVARSHRFQRLARDAEPPADAFEDPVTVALFSTAPDDLGLYGKPMGRNVQIWTEDYGLLLDGPAADHEALAAAARRVRAGGRFDYRFFFPPMQAGARTLVWHRPLVARLDPSTGLAVAPGDPPLGFLGAERPGAATLELAPCLLDREEHREAATAFERDPGHARLTTATNVLRLLEWAELTGGPLDRSLARALLDAGRETSLEEWLDGLAARAASPERGKRAERAIRARLGPVPSPAAEGPDAPPSRTFAHTRTREFEERLWRTIEHLSTGRWRETDNADAVRANAGRHGGKLGRSLGRRPGPGRDLEALGDWLHGRHRECIAKHGMEGRAFVADLRFRWETDFDLPWSDGWARSREADGAERDVVVVIPGRDETSAVILADHYDTAYMEDLYETSRGGDLLRAAAAGADDNHSATATLLLAADALLPLARDGKLARSVWLVHLTGEEFPSDCLGARALARAAVRRELRLTGEDGRQIDLSDVRLDGVFVMDMIAHNRDHDRDVFQIAPGDGAASARLAALAQRVTERWNRSAAVWNREPARRGRGRGVRVPDGAGPPPLAEHLALHGEVRAESDHRSALYNTDGQIFSDAGIPVVLFMENYDIARTGYHDTEDTMKNIDLDYGAALAAIAIESAAEAAG